MAESSRLVQLFWNWRDQKWQDTEDFAVNGGSTLGVQWFFLPPFVTHKGGGKFTHHRVMKFDYQILKVLTSQGSGYTESEIWVGSKITPPVVDLLTDAPSQMPYVMLSDPTETQTAPAWFIPAQNPRYSRGSDSEGLIIS